MLILTLNYGYLLKFNMNKIKVNNNEKKFTTFNAFDSGTAKYQ